MRLKSRNTILVLGLGAACILPARAGEVVRLSNGFSIECERHATVDGHFRVYTGPESYIELNPTEVTGIEEFATVPVSAPHNAADNSVPGPAAANAEPKLTTQELHQILSSAGKSHNLDVDLLASVMRAESGDNTHAVSPKGARGLMQLMPATAADLGVEDRDDANQNVNGGSAYLDTLLMRYHENLALALAAYNAGPAAVDRYKGIPPYRETRLYVARVIHEFNRRVRARQALEARNLQ